MLCVTLSNLFSSINTINELDYFFLKEWTNPICDELIS